jgi:hypothetical protein
MADEKPRVAPRLDEVPAGTQGTPCRGKDCDTVIYWIKVGEGTGRRSIPVDCDADIEGCHPPSSTNDRAQGDMLSPTGTADVYPGHGVNHFTTCPNANDFTRKQNDLGPMTRVAARVDAVQEAQRGIKWLVRRTKLVKQRVYTSNGIRTPGAERFKTVVIDLGHVYASDKTEAEAKARERWEGDGIVVQSAISAQLSLEEQRAVANHKAAKNHGGRVRR